MSGVDKGAITFAALAVEVILKEEYRRSGCSMDGRGDGRGSLNP